MTSRSLIPLTIGLTVFFIVVLILQITEWREPINRLGMGGGAGLLTGMIIRSIMKRMD